MTLIYALWKNETKLCEAKVLFIYFIFLFLDDRSSRPEVFCEKGFLRNFAKFKGKHLCQSLFFNKVAGACFH